MKVIFVGMHNKPGMKPLDSKTMTGKVIDIMIDKMPFACVKTNLCDIDYFPKDFLEINECAIDWYKKTGASDEDVIVLLGNWVQKNFWYDNLNVVKIGHPAGVFGPKNKEVYIKTSIDKIIEAACKHNY